jgi:hypothetical protein
MTIAYNFAKAYKRATNTKPAFKHKMLVASVSMRTNGEDKIYTFIDKSELQVREITNDWQVFK